MADVPNPNAAPAPVPSARLPKPAIRWIGSIVALAAMFVSFSLLQQSFGGLGNPLLARLCGETAAGPTDCQSVINSSWGSWPISPQSGAPRIPVAAFGLGYFAFFAAWFLFVGAPTRGRGWWLLPVLIIALVGVLNSLQLAYAMSFVLKRACLNCYIVHALNAILLIVLLASIPWTRRAATSIRYPAHGHALAALTAGLALFVLPAVVSLLLVMNNARSFAEREYRQIIDDPSFARWSYERAIPTGVPIEDRAHFAGPADAANTVVAFIDLRCSRCKALQEVLEKLTAEPGPSMRIAYRHFPLDTRCNDAVNRAMHEDACAAALALEAARTVGGAEAAEKMRHAIHASPGLLGDADFRRLAADAKLDVAAFDAARASDEVRRRVEADIQLGKQLGLRAAPHVYLNGRELRCWMNAQTWKPLLTP